MLLQAFANRDVKALVIEQQTQIRSMMQDVLREQGVTARSAPNIKDGVALLEAERFDWILMPPAKDGSVTFLHILGHAIRSPHWRGIRMSLLLAEDNPDVVVEAMEFGCLSWHKGPFTKEIFSIQIKTLMDRMYKYNFHSDMIAAAYVRDIDVTDKIKDSVAAMDVAITRLHPGSFKLLLESADSCRKNGNYERALLLLNQARLLETEKSSIAERTINDIQVEMSRHGRVLDKVLTPKDILGFESVAIIDGDSAVQQSLEKALREVGVSDVTVFSDGQSFIDWYQDHNPEMVIMEWRLPVLSGAKVMQRVSLKPDKNPPQFVLVSSSLTQADMPLLKELGAGGVVGKPFSRVDVMGALLKANAGATQSDGVYHEQQIRALIRSKKMKKASQLARAFLKNPAVSVGRKMLIQADLTLAAKKFEQSRDLCLKAMSLPHDSLYGLQILGKCFMGLRQFDYAMKCFDKAQAMSPMNIERICLMAVSEAEQGHKDAANQLMASAKAADNKNEMVLETAVAVSVVQGDLTSARKNIEDLPNIMSVVAFQNNRAVAMAKALRFPESIDVYAKTLQILPEKAKDARDIVLFNLALAYVKLDDLGMADEALAQISAGNESRISPKAMNLRKRVGAAISSGAKLTLKTDDPVTMAGGKSGEFEATSGTAPGAAGQDLSSDGVRMLSLVDFKPGDLCCFKIFSRESKADEALQDMLNTLPPIKSRWSVVTKP